MNNRVLRYLNKEWLGKYLKEFSALLPSNIKATFYIGDSLFFVSDDRDKNVNINTHAPQIFHLMLEDSSVASLLLSSPPQEKQSATNWGDMFIRTLQRVLDLEHARRSVASETLESYRELALLQRAVDKLSSSLDSDVIVDSILSEFDGKNCGTDFGAVFLHDKYKKLELSRSFGTDEKQFESLLKTDFFTKISQKSVGDIVNDTSEVTNIPSFGALIWMPLISQDENLGILILASRKIGNFTAQDLKRARTLSSVAATALRNAGLYAAQQKMFQSFVGVIATAIDTKSPYTAGHCRRVPEIAMMLADAANEANSGALAHFSLDADTKNAIEIAGLLHDFGKVVTPEWIVDKANKLDAIVNRMELVDLRFEILHRDAKIDFLSACLDKNYDKKSAEIAYKERLQAYRDDLAFLSKCNLGTEFTNAQSVDKIRAIANTKWQKLSQEMMLLTDDEIYNLSIEKGTLNTQEREIIESHAIHTINMLSQIEFPHALRNVPEFAGGHHERMDGKGYPYGLTKEELSIPARILAIADIFEALTASDRPYRKHSSLSWAINIMHKMKLEGHIDADLFDLLLSSGVHDMYAKKHLLQDQIDTVEINKYIG